jgi:hypothetical protein
MWFRAIKPKRRTSGEQHFARHVLKNMVLSWLGVARLFPAQIAALLFYKSELQSAALNFIFYTAKSSLQE